MKNIEPEMINLLIDNLGNCRETYLLLEKDSLPDIISLLYIVDALHNYKLLIEKTTDDDILYSITIKPVI